MKRDLELIRRIVLAVEDRPTGFVQDRLEVDGYTPEQIGYHCYLIVNAGLAVGLDSTALGDTGPMWRVLHLTSAGHDFADAVRDERTWRKAASIVRDKAGGVTIELLKDLLTSILKGSMGLP